ncbi:hypothetical protein CFC21_109273, partial [Triticum aestivum]
MAHAADARSRCVVALLFAVAVFLACLPPAATASSSSRSAAAALQRVEMAAVYTPQDLQEKPDVTKDAGGGREHDGVRRGGGEGGAHRAGPHPPPRQGTQAPAVAL